MKTIKRLIAIIMTATLLFISGCSSIPTATTRAGQGNHYQVKFGAGSAVAYVDTKTSFDKNYTPYLYSFIPTHSVGIASNGKMIDMEAEYGITESCNGTKITFKLFNYTKTKLSVKSAVVEGLCTWHTGSENIKLTFNKNVTLDTKKYEIGLFRIVVTFSNKKSVTAYFYVNKDAVSTCICELTNKARRNAYVQRRKNLTNAFKAASKNGVKTDGSSELALDLFYYPVFNWDKATYGQEYRCDTQLWIDLSNSLVNKNWSKDHKAYVIYDWLIRNIAYDDYKGGHSRASEKNDYSGKYNVYNIRTGNCWDFANILAIMYRAQGIPTVQIGSNEMWHDWNAAYINGRWIELDASMNTRYIVKGSDWTKRDINLKESSLYKQFGMCPHDITITADDWVINDELMYGDPNDENNETHYLQ